jgi:hypothetical protein
MDCDLDLGGGCSYWRQWLALRHEGRGEITRMHFNKELNKKVTGV